MEKNGQMHAPATLPPGKNPHTIWIGGWVVQQPVWTFQRREKWHVSTGVWNPYLAACSIVAIAHSFTQTTQWTKTSNQHTLHSPVCIMVPYIVCCYANRPRWYVHRAFIRLNLFVLWTLSQTVCIFSSQLYKATLHYNCHFIHISESG